MSIFRPRTTKKKTNVPKGTDCTKQLQDLQIELKNAFDIEMSSKNERLKELSELKFLSESKIEKLERDKKFNDIIMSTKNNEIESLKDSKKTLQLLLDSLQESLQKKREKDEKRIETDRSEKQKLQQIITKTQKDFEECSQLIKRYTHVHADRNNEIFNLKYTINRLKDTIEMLKDEIENKEENCESEIETVLQNFDSFKREIDEILKDYLKDEQEQVELTQTSTKDFSYDQYLPNDLERENIQAQKTIESYKMMIKAKKEKSESEKEKIRQTLGCKEEQSVDDCLVANALKKNTDRSSVIVPLPSKSHRIYQNDGFIGTRLRKELVTDLSVYAGLASLPMNYF